MENSIALYGASGHGKVIIDILNVCGIKIKAVIDDNPKTEKILGITIVNAADFDKTLFGKIIISIGNNRIRKIVSQKIEADFVKAIHPLAIISSFSQIGNGTVVMAGAIINPDVVIGKHCIINTGAIIEHDNTIEDFVHVCPGVSLAGNVSIGEGTQIGIGATVIQGVKIGKWVTVGAGAVILKDIPDYGVVTGNPGKMMKYNKENE